MKKKLALLCMTVLLGSGLNAHANSAEYTRTFPEGGSDRTVVDGSGLKMHYTHEGNNFASTDTTVSSSLMSIYY